MPVIPARLGKYTKIFRDVLVCIDPETIFMAPGHIAVSGDNKARLGFVR